MITINIIPQPAPRPRFSKYGTYNTDKYKSYKKALATWLRYNTKVMAIDSPIKIEVIFYMPIPKSLSKKKQLLLDNTYHIKKPDNDNMQKAFLDAANGILFKDDSIVSWIDSRKIYSLNPRIEYKVYKIETL